MSKRWEYMSVVWVNATRKNAATGKQEWRAEYGISRKGEPLEKRVQYDYGEDESRVTLLDLANELGAEGWEMIGETVLSSAAITAHGWSEVGSPIEIRWIFKRRLPAE